MLKYLLKMMTLVMFLGTLITSCYKMPTEDDYSLTPVTNNPRITGEKVNYMPSVKY